MSHKPTLPTGLYALVDDSLRPAAELLEVVRALVRAEVRVLQLRLELTPDRPALELVRQAVAVAGSHTAVIVNDRVDLALAAGAAGVHLGDDDLPVDVARRLLGPGALIGATTRSLAEIERAKAQGADHVGLGPIFTTTTKQLAHPPLGLEGFAAICARSPLPVVGIAGITVETIGAVAKAGAHAAAVGSDLLKASDVEARARTLQTAFASGRAN
ncbi:MAG: thiamine phosphate synthase [Myxococcaceae bacterium]